MKSKFYFILCVHIIFIWSMQAHANKYVQLNNCQFELPAEFEKVSKNGTEMFLRKRPYARIIITSQLRVPISSKEQSKAADTELGRILLFEGELAGMNVRLTDIEDLTFSPIWFVDTNIGDEYLITAGLSLTEIETLIRTRSCTRTGNNN